MIRPGPPKGLRQGAPGERWGIKERYESTVLSYPRTQRTRTTRSYGVRFKARFVCSEHTVGLSIGASRVSPSSRACVRSRREARSAGVWATGICGRLNGTCVLFESPFTPSIGSSSNLLVAESAGSWLELVDSSTISKAATNPALSRVLL